MLKKKKKKKKKKTREKKKRSTVSVDYGKSAKINFVKIIIYTVKISSTKYSAKVYHIFSCGCTESPILDKQVLPHLGQMKVFESGDFACSVLHFSFKSLMSSSSLTT